MHKNFSKWLLTLVIALVCVVLLPTQAQAAEESDLTYTVSGNAVTITGCNTAATGELIIPAVIEEKPVTAIGAEAFAGCTGLTGIRIPASVRIIGTAAFAGCENLDELYIKDIAAWCGIQFGSSDANPMYYAEKLYLDDTLLVLLPIPNGVTKIQDYAFYGCELLVEAHLPTSVKYIGTAAFYNCANLTSIKLPATMNYIGSDAFSGCAKLGEITIPAGLTDLEWGVFSRCAKLEKIIIPKDMTVIGWRAFQDCSGLKTLLLHDGITKIDTDAFAGCTALEEVIYCGSDQQWAGINIAAGNDALKAEEPTYHKWGESEVIQKETCSENGVLSTVCTICSGTKVEVIPKTGVHTYGEEWTTDEGGHWHACSQCTTRKEYSRHEFEDENDIQCDVCGYTGQSNHEFEDTWTSDETGHWHACKDCGGKKDMAEHIPGPEATETTPQTCTECGYEIAPVLGAEPPASSEPPESSEPPVSSEPPATSEPVEDTKPSQTKPQKPGNNNSGSNEQPFWWVAIIIGLIAAGGIVAMVLLMRKQIKDERAREAQEQAGDDVQAEVEKGVQESIAEEEI